MFLDTHIFFLSVSFFFLVFYSHILSKTIINGFDFLDSWTFFLVIFSCLQEFVLLAFPSLP